MWWSDRVAARWSSSWTSWESPRLALTASWSRTPRSRRTVEVPAGITCASPSPFRFVQPLSRSQPVPRGRRLEGPIETYDRGKQIVQTIVPQGDERVPREHEAAFQVPLQAGSQRELSDPFRGRDRQIERRDADQFPGHGKALDLHAAAAED